MNEVMCSIIFLTVLILNNPKLLFVLILLMKLSLIFIVNIVIVRHFKALDYINPLLYRVVPSQNLIRVISCVYF